MTRYLFNEEILREDRRSGTYLIKYLVISIILFALAGGIWFYSHIPKVSTYIDLLFLKIQTFCTNHYIPEPKIVHLQIIFCVILGLIGLIVLLCGIAGYNRPRLVLTEKRVCLIKGSKNYREARFDKIETIRIKGRKIILYTADKKLSFGPINDAYATRDAVVMVITKWGEDDYSRQTCCSEPEPITKDGDVFDGEKL